MLPGAPGHPLGPVGWSARVAALFAALPPATVPARVVGVERRSCNVVEPAGLRVLPLFGVAVGDWIALEQVPSRTVDRPSGTVDRPSGTVGGSAGALRLRGVLPRWSALERLGPGGRRQVLAANVDVVLVVVPADRLSLARVEREVAVAWDSGARPVVVLTKLDLAPAVAAAKLAERIGQVEVVATCAPTGKGLEAIRRILVAPVTAVLLGPSGAGKSTLANALLGEERLAVGDVRADGRGRHTTSSRQLVPVPSGGSLVDMPGLRTLATDASDAAVATAFADVDELAGRCRFADCAHESEPDCAVLAAVAAGKLDPERLTSYRRLTDEIVSGPRSSHQRPRAGGTQTTPGRSGPGRQLPDERAP